MSKRQELYEVVNDSKKIPMIQQWVGRMVAKGLPAGPVRISIGRPRRSLDQNAKFYAICRDLELSGLHWHGKPRTTEEWKVLLVSAFMTIEQRDTEIVMGIEGEPVQLRESTTKMSVQRVRDLIEYAQAFCAENGVVTR